MGLVGLLDCELRSILAWWLELSRIETYGVIIAGIDEDLVRVLWECHAVCMFYSVLSRV